MFSTPGSRYVLRSVLVGVGALLSSLAASSMGSDLTTGEILLALSSGWAGGLGYAGLGAVLPAVEPNIGRKP